MHKTANLVKVPRRFIKYRANKILQDARTDGQLESIMFPAHNDGGGIQLSITCTEVVFNLKLATFQCLGLLSSSLVDNRQIKFCFALEPTPIKYHFSR